MERATLAPDAAAEPLETTILWLVHSHVPQSLAGFFNTITLSGSARFLVPASVLAITVLLLARRRFEAVLMASSMVIAPLAVYSFKLAIDRTRPALWDAPWYWGSSFPSGHTLAVATFATAAVMCALRIWPQRRWPAVLVSGFAILWTCAVALSRLILGVHWPTDVLAAIVVGVAIPVFFRKLFDLHQRKWIEKK